MYRARRRRYFPSARMTMMGDLPYPTHQAPTHTSMRADTSSARACCIVIGPSPRKARERTDMESVPTQGMAICVIASGRDADRPLQPTSGTWLGGWFGRTIRCQPRIGSYVALAMAVIHAEPCP